jgi:hypothetical protein
MTVIHERDTMRCRACGSDERASEGYPCRDCGTFICIMCDLRGRIRCAGCDASAAAQPAPHRATDA